MKYYAYGNQKVNGNIYYDKPSKEMYEKYKFIEIANEDIPQKEGYITEVKISDSGEVEYIFNEILPSKDEQIEELKSNLSEKEKKIEDLESQQKITLMGLMDVNSKLRELEKDVK